MQELTHYGVAELSAAEAVAVEGGGFWRDAGRVVGGAIGEVADFFVEFAEGFVRGVVTSNPS